MSRFPNCGKITAVCSIRVLVTPQLRPLGILKRMQYDGYCDYRVLATILDPTSGQAQMYDVTYLTTDVDRQCIANCFLKKFF